MTSGMHALSQALLHSLWQIALIGACVWVLLKFISPKRANLRYYVVLSGLYIVPILFCLTWFYILGNAVPRFDVSVSQPASFVFNWIVILWGVGLCLMLLKFTTNWFAVHTLAKQPTLELPTELQAIFDDIAVRMNMSKKVFVGVSEFVTAPCTIGFWRPLILIPITCMTRLSPQEIEAIMAHELAHIKRADFIHRCVQSIVEAVFYYHPVLHYISKLVSAEREHACDDMAVAVLNNAKPLATGLLVASMMRANNNLILNAGQMHIRYLEYRVSRLVKLSEKPASGNVKLYRRRLWMASWAIGFVAAGMLWAVSLPIIAQAGSLEIDKPFLISLKDDICKEFRSDRIYYNPKYDDGAEANVTFQAKTVLMNGRALPAQTQSAVRKILRKHDLPITRISEIEFFGDCVKLTLLTDEGDAPAVLITYVVDPHSDDVHTHTQIA